jgi:lysophospholipase L1-like esterase
MQREHQLSGFSLLPFRLNEEAPVRRLSLVSAGICAALALAVGTAIPAAAAPDHSGPGNSAPGRPAPAHRGAPEFYLSLGDSLSVGDQPNAQGVTLPTNQGYPDQLYAMLRPFDHNLVLAKLGCPGETTATMINGGICGYAGDQRFSLTADKGNQLAAALAFLRAHRGHVPLITIDIGANDLNSCVVLTSISAVAACATPAIETAGQNTAAILAQLRAADPSATIVGMTYYVPELAEWLTGPAGEAFAEGSIPLGEALNSALTAAFTHSHARVADVFTAFDSADITSLVNLPGFGAVPKDVALICQLTWECAAPPVGPNEHANAAGYAVIARTFFATLGRRD